MKWHPRGFAAQLRRTLEKQGGTGPVILDRMMVDSIAECLDDLALRAPAPSEAVADTERELTRMRQCEAYIRSLRWNPETPEEVRNLVIANVRAAWNRGGEAREAESTHPAPARGVTVTEAVAWAVYDAHGRMMTYTESRTKADAERARYEGYGDKVWVMNRPFSVVPLYPHPAPARRVMVTETMLLNEAADAVSYFASTADEPEMIRVQYHHLAARLRAAALTPDAEGGA